MIVKTIVVEVCCRHRLCHCFTRWGNYNITHKYMLILTSWLTMLLFQMIFEMLLFICIVVVSWMSSRLHTSSTFRNARFIVSCSLEDLLTKSDLHLLTSRVVEEHWILLILRYLIIPPSLLDVRLFICVRVSYESCDSIQWSLSRWVEGYARRKVRYEGLWSDNLKNVKSRWFLNEGGSLSSTLCQQDDNAL